MKCFRGQHACLGVAPGRVLLGPAESQGSLQHTTPACRESLTRMSFHSGARCQLPLKSTRRSHSDFSYLALWNRSSGTSGRAHPLGALTLWPPGQPGLLDHTGRSCISIYIQGCKRHQGRSQPPPRCVKNGTEAAPHPPSTTKADNAD